MADEVKIVDRVDTIVDQSKVALQVIVDEAEAKSTALRVELATKQAAAQALATKISGLRRQIAELEGPEAVCARHGLRDIDGVLSRTLSGTSRLFQIKDTELLGC